MFSLTRLFTRPGFLVGAAAATCVLAPQILLLSDSHQAKTESKLRLVPITSDTRLEDIQESFDGTRLITHDRGFAPKLWDTKTLTVLAVLGSRSNWIQKVFFSPDSSRIVTIAANSVHIWDGRLAHDLATIPAEDDNHRWIAGAVSADNKWLALATAEGQISICPMSNPKITKTWKAHTDAIYDIKFSPDGRWIVSASKDKTAKVWNASSFELKSTLSAQTELVQWAQVSPDSRQVLTTSADNTACLYDLESGKLVFRKPHQIGEKGFRVNTLMSALFVGPKGEGVLCANSKGLMEVFDRATGMKIRELKGHSDAVREIRQTNDRLRVATYGTDEELKIWDAMTGKELPFDRKDSLPTAGEFSADGSVFWIGTADGNIERHEIISGKVTSQRVSDIRRIEHVHVSNDGQSWWVQYPLHGFSRYESTTFRPDNPKEQVELETDSGHPVFSPNGQFVLSIAPEDAGGVLSRFDLRENVIHFKKGLLGGCFTADSKFLMTWHESNQVFLWDVASGEAIHAWKMDAAKPKVATISPDGKFIASDGNDKDEILVWSMETGSVVATLPKSYTFRNSFVFSPDSKSIAKVDGDQVTVYDVATGKAVRPFVLPKQKGEEAVSLLGAELVWVAGGKRIAAFTNYEMAIWDVATGKLELFQKGDLNQRVLEPERMFSPDGNRVVLPSSTSASVFDIASGTRLYTLEIGDQPSQVSFLADGKKIVSVDPGGGISVWRAEPTQTSLAESKTLQKQVSYFSTLNGGYLVIDPQGRYDAPDPAKVECASYVMEWSGGLEPMAVAQLKQQFYEPGLLAKVTGTDKEALRAVPDLAGLHLYPEVSLKRSTKSPMVLDVRLTERDNGGIGKVQVFMNGKLVTTKEGIGYFSFDVSENQQYLLPQSQLEEGRGNLVSVRAMNETGDLMSIPVSVDIGVPAGLKTPEIKLYALCVGTGDYAGSAGDLTSPPSDAKALSAALGDAGRRLLPNRVEIQTLVTGDPSALPTKAAITKWFADVSKKATSSDIVFVFLSGHGTSRIADMRDYFYLTMESDPSDLNALSASSGAISGSDLKKMLAGIPAAKQVVVLDTCHSGAASKSLMGASRSVSGDYQRAYEAIRETTGTWMLAGSAADQLSYESSNVDHGMLTYALLEAIDKVSPEGLRTGSDGQMFLDVDQWLSYAASRVESLKNEIGIAGLQRPEFKRSSKGSSFDLGVTNTSRKGSIGLKSPRPIAIMGSFEQDQEDPLGIEKAVAANLKESTVFKLWTDVVKHPNVYRIAGTYTVEGGKVTVNAFLQKFDGQEDRKKLESFTITGAKSKLSELIEVIRKEFDARIEKREKPEGN